MALKDWDELLLWLRENGAPRWCIKLRERELRAKQYEMEQQVQGYSQNCDPPFTGKPEPHVPLAGESS